MDGEVIWDLGFQVSNLKFEIAEDEIPIYPLQQLSLLTYHLSPIPKPMIANG
jgi:hypothetical protein